MPCLLSAMANDSVSTVCRERSIADMGRGNNPRHLSQNTLRYHSFDSTPVTSWSFSISVTQLSAILFHLLITTGVLYIPNLAVLTHDTFRVISPIEVQIRPVLFN